MSGGGAKGGKSAMPSASALRLMSEAKELMRSPPAGVSAAPTSDDDVTQWTASIVGPEETAWEGGIFRLQLSFGPEYPAKPPRVKFTPPIFHPNVYGNGELCLDILQSQWTPALSISSLLVSVASLLTDPNPASPANPEAARLYEKDKKAYRRRVRQCAERSLDS
mmetsp:Transcript_10422/g.24986  ORF Transcript_10422/g.24986 Transcript_10422/m.24986 type:complete len:165 (+) Transcript_10422:74-568(+)